MKVPTRIQAEGFISEAQILNPGQWIQHSYFAAKAAEAIAKHHPTLDHDTAFVLGYLHDIGRIAGVTDMRHIFDGYTFLMERGFDKAAQICLTHSFPIKDIRHVAAKWDCSREELEFLKEYLASVEFDDYDRLIQLCDALALPEGFCLIEKRLMDVALRHGVNEFSVSRWKEYLRIQEDFGKAIGQSIYKVLPGVIENTFGFSDCLD